MEVNGWVFRRHTLLVLLVLCMSFEIRDKQTFRSVKVIFISWGLYNDFKTAAYFSLHYNPSIYIYKVFKCKKKFPNHH
ncbi:hypothetical protein V6Z11_A03G248200 [Gossypium hirsutum]